VATTKDHQDIFHLKTPEGDVLHHEKNIHNEDFTDIEAANLEAEKMDPSDSNKDDLATMKDIAAHRLIGNGSPSKSELELPKLFNRSFNRSGIAPLFTIAPLMANPSPISSSSDSDSEIDQLLDLFGKTGEENGRPNAGGPCLSVMCRLLVVRAP